jgi:cytochrome c551/c552
MRYEACAMLIVAIFLSACSSGAPARLLAEKTAANVGVIGAHLNTLSLESGKLAELRAANIARLHAANTQLRASYNYDIALTRRSGGEGAAHLDLISQLERWGKEIENIFAAAENAEKERKAAVLASQTKLDTKSESLGRIAQALATLAKEETNAERARFLAGYAKEIDKEMKARLEQDDKSATEAKKLLGKIKDSL